MSWLLWTLVILLDVASFLFARRVSDEPVDPVLFRRLILIRAVTWYCWWLLTPAVFYLANRFRFESGTRLKSFAVHAAAALVVIQLINEVAVLFAASMHGPSVRAIAISLATLLQYATLCGIALIIGLRRRERDHMIAASKLEAELAQAQLRALTSQLRPHFLYNALNGVAMLIRANANDAALESVVGYGELLRHVLEADAADVSLREELAFIDRYLAIERMRFPGTFAATVSAETEVADALVPNFLLQPLVENALHHGLGQLEAGARLDVLATRRGANLRLEVHDNGVGLSPNWRFEGGSGVGLRNTRSRLRQRYGDAYHFELHSPAEGGTVVILEIPYQPWPAVRHA